jgi:hypothetical protein
VAEGDSPDRPSVLNVPNNFLFSACFSHPPRHKLDSWAAFFSDLKTKQRRTKNAQRH